MARFVTPAGVEIEMSAKAAANVGYKPAERELEVEKPARQTRTKKTEK